MVKLEEPDKGHAWIVLLGACAINLILSGMARMIGYLYVAVIEAYGVTRKEASVPFTVRNSVRYMAGPLVGVLGETYGIRNVTFFGGLIAAAGSIFCAFVPTVEWIVVCWGLIHGVGYALANTLFQVIINQYFEKHRATASGIVLSGACVGALVFPLMIESMISEYGVYGLFILLGGLFLNVLPPSLVLQMPQWVEYPEAYARKRAEILKLSAKEQSNKRESLTVCHLRVPGVTTSIRPNKYLADLSQKMYTLQIQPGAKQHDSEVVCTLYHPLDVDKLQPEENYLQNGIPNIAFVPDATESYGKNFQAEARTSTVVPPRKRKKDGFFKNFQKIPRLYRNPVYCLISFSLAMYFTVFLPVLTVIVDYNRDKGIPRSKEQFLIHAFTIGDLIGRLGFGWVTDRRLMSCSNFMALAYVAQGFFVSILPLCKSLVLNVVFLGLYGISAGIIFTYVPVLVHRYVDKDMQSIAIGCVGLLSSTVSFSIPPLIGYFRDHVGSYDGLFYCMAGFSMVPGGLWLLVSLRETMQEKKKTPVDT